jgi:hypothetical protein
MTLDPALSSDLLDARNFYQWLNDLKYPSRVEGAIAPSNNLAVS